jgi:transposase
MEATGSYWVALAVRLHDAGYAVAVINPRVSHNYAKTLPRRSKTDALDAQLLRQFAIERQRELVRWSPPPAAYHELRQRLVARDALAEMRQQARNQRHAVQQWPVQISSVVAQFDAVEADLDGRVAQLDRAIATLLQDGAWAESAALLQTIPGIGPSTAAWLLVATMNFALCASAEAAVAYLGLNPLEHQSGTSVRGRPQLGRGGHKRVRQAVYMASMSAAQHNPLLHPLYTRLRAKGKPSKLAHCAVARKLVHIAWAVVTKQQPFDPCYRQSVEGRPI